MKRIISIIISTILICFMLSSCGKPNNVSQEMYDIGIAALKVADDYISYEIDGNTAKSKINYLSEDASSVYERNKKTDFRYGDCTLMTTIHSVSSKISVAEYNGVPSDVKCARDELAKSLWK